MDYFQIDLLDQYWANKDNENQTDFCSHGEIYLKINDQEIITEKDGAWTVSSAALRLIKSALYGYDRKNDLPIISCCGYLMNYGCPAIVSWDAQIIENIIELSNFEIREVKYRGCLLFQEGLRVDLEDYSRQALVFARKVKRFYSINLPRIFTEKSCQDEYEEYWRLFEIYFDLLSERCKRRND